MIIEPNERRLARDINNTASTSSLDHPTRNMPRHQRGTSRIHTHHAIEARSRRIDSALKNRRACTIDKPIENDIERTQSFIDGSLVTDVKNQRLTPRLLSEPRQFAHVARRRHNLRAAGAQQFNRHATNAARSARDENSAPGKIEG